MAPKFDFSKGLGQLDDYLLTRSYIEGYSFSPADSKVFADIPSVPCASSFPNAYRWYLHIAALSGLKAVISSSKAPASGAPAAKKAAPPAKKAAKADDDDDFELFADDDAPAAEAPKEMSRAEKIAAMKAEKEAKEKANKKKDRSQIVLEVKPVDTEVDLDALYVKIKNEIQQPGLTWGEGYNKVPVAYGIFKLVISMVIVDEDVSVDDVTEKIESFEDEVQSTEIAAFNKL